ncbi:MAG: PEP-utilizing enzyme [Candidatus Micrarchaeota archaeon]
MYPVAYMPFKPMKAAYGDWHHILMVFFKDNYGNWYWNDNDMVRLRKELIVNVSKDEQFLQKLMEKWQALVKKYQKKIDKIERTDLSKLSAQDFNALYQDFFDAYVMQYGIAIGVQDPFSMHAQNFLEPAFKKFIAQKGKTNQFNELYAELLAPILPSFVNEEKKTLLEILAKIQANNLHLLIILRGFDYAAAHLDEMPEIEKMLEKHAREFYWVQNNYAKVKCLDKLYFLNELCTLQKAGVNGTEAKKEIEQHLENSIKLKAKLIKQLQVPKELLDLIKISEIFTYMQDERKKNVLIANHYQRKFIDEASRRTGISPALLEYTILPELKEIVKTGEANLKVLAARRKSCLIIHTREGHEIFDGEETLALYATLFGKSAKAIAEVTGSCASEGKATGLAKIVLKTHDMINMQEGDVLITSMTRPEMVPVMKKAVAIITDEGGVTSHAAIVSRELGIPCIVGAKHATRVFKDGDLVEVDAGKGTARKIGEK